MGTEAELKKDEDELEIKVVENDATVEEVAAAEVAEVEVEDDTPEADRDKTPMPQKIVDELEADELDEYSDKVKQRLKQMKKVWHDERRAKEEIERQHTESLNLTKQLMAENRHIRSRYAEGEKTLVDTFKGAAELEFANAKREYKVAYDAGDSDAVVDAQQALNAATMKIERAKNYIPTLQDTDHGVYNTEQPQVPEIDDKTKAWQKRNKWYGSDPEMTALALGHHQTLERTRGQQYIGTDEYWAEVDVNMKKRFPERFETGTTPPESTESVDSNATQPSDKKPANVVAPASRSTGSKRIVLRKSQVELAKKLGITPEEYAQEYAKTLED